QPTMPRGALQRDRFVTRLFMRRWAPLMRHFPLMVVRVTVMATIVAVLLIVTASLFLWDGGKTIVSTPAPAVNVDGQSVQKDPAASPRRPDEDQLSTKQIKPKPATILGRIMMMLGAQHGR